MTSVRGTSRSDGPQRATTGHAAEPVGGPGPRSPRPPGAHQLPWHTAAFVERQRELADVVAALRRDDVRLVTLVGPPGTGKTWLGLAVAEAVLDWFADGVYLVDLAPLRDPRLVSSTIAQVLGISDMGNRRLEDTLRQVLGDQEVLLLLDNFEQLLQAGSLVATRQQQVERAARLFAIADALCDAANYHLPPGVVAFHEQAVAGVRAVLGAREFGDAWAAGRKLPLDEAVAFAMGAGVPRRRSVGNTPELSRREMQVVQLVAEGLSDRQIASRLGISPRTVDNHLRHIFEKVGVSSRTALATWALRSALVA